MARRHKGSKRGSTYTDTLPHISLTSGIKLKKGLVIAIEPMINMGLRGIVQQSDGWTITTVDKKPSAHFEHTIVVREGAAEILSSFKEIEKILNKNG
mgnify:CR=1 FL=1